MSHNDLCFIGTFEADNQTRPFGMLTDDRRRHVYIIGKSGMGKSTLLENMILQDIHSGHGVCFLDPLGDSAEYILQRIPSYRKKDVVYFDPTDVNHPIGFNMLEVRPGEQSFLVASGLTSVLQKLWAGGWSSRMEYILNNTVLALLETEGNSLLGIVKMLTDANFRNYIVNRVQNILVKNFWLNEFSSFNDRYQSEAIAPILNKVGQFFSTEIMRNVLGQSKSTIDFRSIMDQRKILIANLSKGKLGEDNSSLLGSLLVTKFQLAAMSRANIPENQRQDFFLYADEFQNFTSDSFATIFSEARKYRLNLTLAHQYIAQLNNEESEKVKNAILGNVGTILSFRVGADDAELLEKEMEPVLRNAFVNLDRTQIIAKVSIQNRTIPPFLANTLPPLFPAISGNMEQILDLSRKQFASDRGLVEKQIQDYMLHGFVTEAGESLVPAKKKRKRKRKKKTGDETQIVADDGSDG